MIAKPTRLPDVVVLEPVVYEDARGYFFEAWNARAFKEATGLDREFVQDNQSRSQRDVLRGLHYQLPNPQGKLVRVIRGAIWDVAVDIRRSSETFGDWVGVELTSDNRKCLWVPEGFAHGFAVLSDEAEVLYKTTAYYDREADRGVRFDDPAFGVEWPIDNPTLSDKDEALPFSDIAILFD